MPIFPSLVSSGFSVANVGNGKFAYTNITDDNLYYYTFLNEIKSELVLQSDPVTPMGISTKQYSDLRNQGAFTVDFTQLDAGTFNVGSELPIGAIITKYMVNIDNAFDGTTATLTLGNTSAADAIFNTTVVDLHTNDLYVNPSFNKITISDEQQTFATLTMGDATVGGGSILIEYYIP